MPVHSIVILIVQLHFFIIMLRQLNKKEIQLSFERREELI